MNIVKGVLNCLSKCRLVRPTNLCRARPVEDVGEPKVDCE